MKQINGLIRVFVILSFVGSLAACGPAYYPPTYPPSYPSPPPPGPAPGVGPGDLHVTDLDMAPDPIHGGDMPRFMLTLHNRSPWAGFVRIYILDRDERVAEAHDVRIHGGSNRIGFPRTGYRFHRADHCFRVQVDIEGTMFAVDTARTFCARRTPAGWSLAP